MQDLAGRSAMGAENSFSRLRPIGQPMRFSDVAETRQGSQYVAQDRAAAEGHSAQRNVLHQ